MLCFLNVQRSVILMSFLIYLIRVKDEVMPLRPGLTTLQNFHDRHAGPFSKRGPRLDSAVRICRR